jgi:hypothetical protein
MRLTLTLCFLAFAAHSAADTSRLDDRWRFEGAVGLRIGSFLINNAPATPGDDASDTMGGHVAVGLRRARWLLFTEYELFSISGDTVAVAERGDASVGFGSGVVHRLGAHARHAFARMNDDEISFEVYLDGGLGVQHFRWDDGGYWTRPDISLGFGFTFWGAERRAHGAISAGVRILLAKRGDVGDGAPAACGGPCEAPTGPTTFDRSIMVDVTLAFGR